MKDYIKKNKDRRQEYIKKYSEDNKEIITKKLKEKITCKCGCEINKHHRARHQISKKHMDLINQIQ